MPREGRAERAKVELASYSPAQQEFLNFVLDQYSRADSDELQDEGVFGPLLTVFPTEGLKWIQRYGIDDATSCYGLRYKHVQLAGLWQKGTFKFFRLEYGRRKV